MKFKAYVLFFDGIVKLCVYFYIASVLNRIENIPFYMDQTSENY